MSIEPVDTTTLFVFFVLLRKLGSLKRLRWGSLEVLFEVDRRGGTDDGTDPDR